MWNVDQLLLTLPIMGKGMAGIFLVTAVIILCIAVLNGLSSLSGKKKDS